jgi:hypothetical protein
MNPWRLWQQGFCMLAVSFLLGIATALYHVIRVSQLHRRMAEVDIQTATQEMVAGHGSWLGSLFNWSAIVTFAIAVGLLLLGLISYCGQRAKAESPP